jgi:hypothetical protein
MTQDAQLRIDRFLHIIGEEVCWFNHIEKEQIWVRFNPAFDTAWTSGEYLIEWNDIIIRVDQDRNREDQYWVCSVVRPPLFAGQQLTLKRM